MRKSIFKPKRTTVGLLLLGVASSQLHAANVSKADNNDSLNLPTSWVSGATPTGADIAVWDSTVSTDNTTNVLGASTNWAGIRILNPAAPVTIITNSGGNTLTLGASGIDLSSASQPLTLSNATVLLGATAQKWTPGTTTLTIAGPLTRNSRAVLDIDTSLGGLINIPSGTASSLLYYAILNQTDFSALDASFNLLPGASVLSYTPNPTGTAANSASISGSATVLDVVNSNPAGAPSAFRLSNTFTVSGIRVNTPNSNNIDWVIDATTRNLNFSSGCFLVTENVGNHNVIEQDTATGFRLGTGSEMIVAQYNTSGDFLINGHITQSSGTGANVTKTGPGRLVINNTGNNFTGTLTIHQGTVLVNGSIASATVVNKGGTLGGSGQVVGVTVSSGGTLTSGSTNGVGTLTIGGALNLNSGAALSLYGPTVPTTNTVPLLLVTNGFTASSPVSVSIMAGVVSVGQYPLLKWTNQIPAATFAAFSAPTLRPRVSGYLSNNLANNSIDLVITNVAEPLTWAASSGTWDIGTSSNWKDSLGHTATYQEFVSIGDSVLFEDTQSGASPLNITLNTIVSPAATTVNAAKSYSISGTGTIDGIGALTKSGTGTLTLGTQNSFSGGLNLNGGTVVFSALTNLGSGALIFGGGTLKYSSGAFDDISAKTVTFGAGGGSIDDGGNTLNLANPIGNNGVGGFNKLGAGSLTLNGTNKYSGNTTITAGTLVLGGNTYVSNSAAIIVNSGAMLDTATWGTGLSLNTANNQILAGSGTVSGPLTITNNTTISPGTNGIVGTLTLNGDLTMSGGTYAYDVSTTGNDLLVVNGNLTLNSGTILTITAGSLNNGTYKLIQYNGALLSGQGSSANVAIVGFNQAGKIAQLSDATPGEIDLVVATAGGAVKVWQGDGINNFWDIETTADWTNTSGAAAVFVQADKAIFDDTSINTTVDLQAGLQPGSVTVNGTQNYTLYTSANGKLAGSTGLTNNSTGLLTILTANINTGPTVINAGTVMVGNNAAPSDLGTGNVQLNNNSTLNFAQIDNRSVSGVVSGTGTLHQQGSAVLTLANNNTYAGQTTIDSGVLQLGAGGTTGSLGTGSLIDNGMLYLNRSGNVSFPNAISGSGGIAKLGSSTLTLGNNLAFQGNTFVSNGVVKLSGPEQVPSLVTVSGSTGWLILDGSPSFAGAFDLNGFNQTVNALSGLFGTVNGVITNSGTTGTNRLTVGDGNNTTYNGTIVDSSTSAKIELVKQGSGELRINGGNTYSGGTFVSQGTIGIGPGGVLGSDGITLSNGTVMSWHNNGSTSSGAGNAITIPDGQAATFNSTAQNNTYSGSVFGGPHSTNLITGAWSASAASLQQWGNFPGYVEIASGGTLRFSANANLNDGGSNTIFNIDSGGGMMCRNQGAVNLGALMGSGNIGALSDAGSINQVATYIIGAKGIDCQYDGIISDNPTPGVGKTNALVKTGPGRFILTAANTYSGNTTVNQGTLLLASSASLPNTLTLSVANGALLDVSAVPGFTLNPGQTIGGSGSINGAVTLVGTSQLAPGGAGTTGILILSNSLAMQGPLVTNLFDLSDDATGQIHTNDQVVIHGDLNVSGMNEIALNALNNNLSAGSYVLFKYTGNLINESGVVANGGVTANLELTGAIVQQTRASLTLSNSPGQIVLIVGAGPSIVWKGDGAANWWDLTNSPNWLSNSAPSQFYQMDSVTFDDSSTNLNVVLTNSNVLAPSAIAVNSASNYTFRGTGLIGGSAGITKSGTGTLTITNTGGNTFDGTVTINGGTLKAAVATALGSTNGGTVINNGGTLDVGGQNLGAEPVTVATGGAIGNSGASQLVALQKVTLSGDATFTGPNRWDIRTNATGSLAGNGHKLTKAGTNDIYLVSLGDTGLGDIEIQQGRLGIQDTTTMGLAGNTLTIDAGAGVDFWNSSITNSKIVQMNSGTISSSSGTNQFGGAITLNGNETFTATTPLVLQGVIGGAGNLFKNGASNLTLTAANTYTGNTTISNGALALTGSGSISGSAIIDVISGGSLDASALSGSLFTLGANQTLKGNGTVRGSVSAPSGAVVSPGDGLGTLTVTATATLAGTTVIGINDAAVPNSSRLSAASIQYGGTLTVNNAGPAPVLSDSFTLFSGAYSGSFSTVNLPALSSGLAWSNSLAVDGKLTVVSSTVVNRNPTNIVFSASSGNLTLSWPADHTGWHLYSNSVSLLSTGSWFEVSGATSTNQVVLPVDKTQPNVFFRLVSP